jgi:hypothetical protein
MSEQWRITKPSLVSRSNHLAGIEGATVSYSDFRSLVCPCVVIFGEGILTVRLVNKESCMVKGELTVEL